MGRFFWVSRAGGRGVAAALLARRTPEGIESTEPVFDCGSGSCRAVPLVLGGGDAVLILFGTGLRNASQFSVRIGGLMLAPTYAGPQPAFLGLDQVNVGLPPELAGAGSVEVAVVADDRESNRVTIAIR